MWIQHHPITIACWLILLFLVGCSPVTQTPSTTLAAISSPTLTSTLTLTKTRIPTDIPTKNPTSTGTPLPPTSIPTLPEATVQAWIDELLQTNDNCRLPCWWGITPGQTSWADAIKILEPISNNHTNTSTEAWYGFPDLEHNFFISQHFILEDDLVDMIEIQFGNADFITLPELLTEYGPPSEIYLHTYSTVHEGLIPSNLILYYADQGMIIRFDDNEGQLTKDNQVRLCFQQYPAWGVILWSPDQKRSYKDLMETAQRVGLGDSRDMDIKVFILEESTDLDIASFFNIFKIENNTTCLETPMKYWPGQFQ